MSDRLAFLVCGSSASPSELDSILSHLANSLATLSGAFMGLKNASPETLTFYGPWIGRSLLEVSFCSFIARIDPFRMLALKKIQKHGDFHVHTRSPCSIQWTGDIMATEELSDLWSPKKGFDKVSRAIFAAPAQELFWAPAFKCLMDLDTSARNSDWLVSARKMDEDAFLKTTKGNLQRIYSSLSKGVHHEFILPPESQYDDATVKTLLNLTLETVSNLALISHLINPVSHALEIDVAIDAYENIQQTIQL